MDFDEFLRRVGQTFDAAPVRPYEAAPRVAKIPDDDGRRTGRRYRSRPQIKDRDAVIRDCAAGTPMAAIARAHGCSLTTVSRIARQNGLGRR